VGRLGGAGVGVVALGWDGMGWAADEILTVEQ
jgi:hypothetical protein